MSSSLRCKAIFSTFKQVINHINSVYQQCFERLFDIFKLQRKKIAWYWNLQEHSRNFPGLFHYMWAMDFMANKNSSRISQLKRTNAKSWKFKIKNVGEKKLKLLRNLSCWMGSVSPGSSGHRFVQRWLLHRSSPSQLPAADSDASSPAFHQTWVPGGLEEGVGSTWLGNTTWRYPTTLLLAHD